MISSRSLLAVLLVLGPFALGLCAPSARADEILYRDPNTCAEAKIQGVQIAGETWTEVRYKEGKRTERSIPSALVMRVVREDSSPQSRNLLDAIGELERGNLTEARGKLRVLSGGGFSPDLDSGQLTFKGFADNDPTGRGKRPSWLSEYAHFHYAKALVEEGLTTEDKELLKEALLTLVDQPIPGGEAKGGKKAMTGGFLGRFEGGNSRFYPEAMLLKARALLALGKIKGALQAYKDLDDKAALDIGPRWAFEAKIGPAHVAEAEGKYLDAITAANDAATTMRLMLKDEMRPCLRRQLGRLFSRARMMNAKVRLQQAEKSRSAAEFRELRSFIRDSSPAALESSFGTLPGAQRAALVAGAMDPKVQAVFKNALGFAALQERKYEEAILAFRLVEVKYFNEPEEHARALHYLAQASDEAAKKASRPAQKQLFTTYRDRALARLQEEHPQSKWAKAK